MLNFSITLLNCGAPGTSWFLDGHWSASRLPLWTVCSWFVFRRRLLVNWKVFRVLYLDSVASKNKEQLASGTGIVGNVLIVRFILVTCCKSYLNVRSASDGYDRNELPYWPSCGHWRKLQDW